VEILLERLVEWLGVLRPPSACTSATVLGEAGQFPRPLGRASRACAVERLHDPSQSTVGEVHRYDKRPDWSACLDSVSATAFEQARYP